MLRKLWQITQKVLSVLLYLLMFMLALSAFRAALIPVMQYVGSLGWVATEGEIISSGIEDYDTDDGTYHHPWATYNYAVNNGATHVGYRLFFGQNWDSPLKRTAQNVIDRYPPGQKITVYYNPHEPTQSVVERRVSVYVIIAIPVILLIGGGFIGLTLYGLVKRWRERQSIESS